MNYVIYRKEKDGEWTKHHVQPFSYKEASALFEMLKESYPSFKWAMIALMVNS